ncbi:MAG: right-handed parallel beta-helix repeat-containing protein [Betaproteobacteria bacterium]|nr:right-handed parallel beta-helix repeat-containing protein [Betaproteobacteria bacterium]
MHEVQDDDGNRVGLSLHANRADALANANAIDIAPSTNPLGRHFLEATYVVDPATAVTGGAIAFGALARPFDTVVYHNGGGQSIGGLVDDAAYYVFTLDGNTAILLNTLDLSDSVQLDASVAAGTQHRFERVQLDSVDEDNLPDIRMGAAAAIAVSAARPVSEASIGSGATIEANAVSVVANMNFNADADADATAIDGPAAVGAALAGGYSEGRHIAEIGKAATVTASTLSLLALGQEGVAFDYDANAASGALALGGNVAGSLAVNAMRNYTAVRVGEDAIVTVDGQLDLLANVVRTDLGFLDSNRVRSEATAGEAAIAGLAAAGAAGAGAITLEGDINEASIGKGAVVNAPDGVEVRASTNHEFDSLGIGGSASLVFAASIGAAFNYTNSEALARVDGSVNTDGDLNVIASTGNEYAPEALGLAAAGLVAIGGSVEANVIQNTTRAAIGGGTIGANSVTVSATDTSTLSTDTGTLAASGLVAAGGAVGANVLHNTVEAYIGDAEVTTAGGSVSVTASSGNELDALALGASLAGLVAGVGTLTYNDIATLTGASLRKDAVVESAGSVNVTASDSSTLQANSGGLAVSLGAGVGASFAVNKLANTVEAYSDEADVTVAEGFLELNADSSNDVDASALAFSISGLVGGYGTVSDNTDSTSTTATIRNGGLIEAPVVRLRARDDSLLDADGGGLAVSLNAGAGATLSRNTMTTKVEAGIGAATVETTGGNVDILAVSSHDVDALGIGFSLAGAIGGVGTASMNEITDTTRAFIDDDATVTSGGAVLVVSLDDSSFDADAGGVGAGAIVGAGLSFASTKVVNTVESIITGEDTEVATETSVSVHATLSPSAGATATGFSVSAFASASGAVSIAESGGKANAAITGKAKVSGGPVSIRATADPTLTASSGGLSASAFAAAGVMISETLAGHSAFAEANGSITASQLDVVATATRTGSADTNFFGISIQSGEVGFEAEEARGNTEAFIGTDADIDILGNGSVNVSATSNDTSDPNIVDVGAGVLTIGAQATLARAESNTRARVAGRVNARSGSVSSTANKTASATTNIFAINLLTLNGVGLSGVLDFLPDVLPIPIGTPADTDARATIRGTNEAYLAQGADVTTANAFSLTATSSNNAVANNLSAGLTLVNVADTASTALVEGQTRVHIDQGASMNVGSFTSIADADSDAVAGAEYGGASAVNVQIAEVTARTDHKVEAFVGPDSGVQPDNTLTGTLRVGSGGMNLQAKSANTATVPQVNVDMSAVTVEKLKPVADAGGATRAHLGGNFDIFASDVRATANSTNSARAEAVAFELNLVDIDLNERTVGTSHTTETFLGPNAMLDVTGGSITLDADSSNNAVIDQISPLDLGAVDLNFVTSTATAGGTTRSFVDEGGTITATGGLAATADSDNDARVLRFQFGASLFSLNEASPTAKTDHRTAAYVGPAAGVEPAKDVSGTIKLGGGLDLDARSTNDASIDDVNIQMSGVSVDLVKPVITTGGSTRTHVGGAYAVSTTGVTGEAVATNQAGSTTVPIKLGLVDVTEVRTEVKTDHAAEAFVSRNADFDVNGGGISLTASQDNTADLDRFEFGVSFVGVNTFKPVQETAGVTRAFVEEGAVVEASSLALDAAAENTVDSNSTIVTLAAVSFSTIRPTLHNTHVVETYIGPRAGAASTGAVGSINVSGALTLNAHQSGTGNTVSLDAISLSFGLVNGDSVRPDIVAGGKTQSYLGGRFAINAGSTSVSARSPNNTASSSAFSLDVGLVNAGGGTTPVEVNHQTSAYIADGADLDFTGGGIGFTAESTSAADASSFSVDIGLVDVVDLDARATVNSSTRSFVGANARVDATGSLSFTARSLGSSATAALSSVGVALVDAPALTPTAISEQTVEAFLAGGATVNAGNISLSSFHSSRADADVDTVSIGLVTIGDVTPTARVRDNVRAFVDAAVTSAALALTATAVRTSDTNANIVSVGLGAGAGADPTAETRGDTQVYFGSGSSVTATGNVTANATATNRAEAEGDVGAGGGFADGQLDATVTLTGGTTAYVNAGARILQAGNFQLRSLAANTARADAATGSGGFAAVQGTQSTATVTPTVEAVIDNNVVMQNVGGSVTLHAESVRAEGDAIASASGGGFVEVGAANSDSTVTPTVNAYIDRGTTIDAAGSVTVEALARSQPAAALDDTFDPDAQTVSADSITFTSHGLSNGDRVTYDPNGNPAIATADGGTLSSSREYSVIATGEDTLQLGAVFGAGAANTGNPLASVAGVDDARDRLRFAVAHGFLTGDAVKYTQDGVSISTDLNGAGTYFVRKLDDYTVKLYTTRNEALAAGAFADDLFLPSLAVNSATDRITVAGSGFSENQRITYQAAPAGEFTSEQVDLNVVGGVGTPTDNNQFYIASHGFGTGNRVIYRVEPDGTAIGGLTSGTAYFVIVIDANHIQLAATRDAADPDDGDDDVPVTPIALSPDKSSPANQQRHQLVRESVGGLQDGVTYYARNVSGDSFQLATAFNGSPITNLDGSGRVGVHRFSRPGVDLTPGTGTHSLRFDLTSAPGANHLLLGPGGVSLRELSPPAGDGKSASSARGGGGGFIAVGHPDSNLQVTQNVQAYIAPALLEAGGNVSVFSSSSLNTSSLASNGGGGFIAVGDSSARGDHSHNNRAFIGTNDGGNIDGSGVVVRAAGHLSVVAESSFDSKITSNSDAGGFVADVNAASRGGLIDETQAVAGSNADVEARSVAMRSQWSHLQFTYDSDASAGGLFGDAGAESTGQVNPHATTAVRGGARVTGFEGVDLRARLDNSDIDQDISAAFVGLGGSSADDEATYSPQTLVDADPGATVSAGPRLFPVAGVPPADVTPLQQPAGFDRLALFVEIDAEDGTRDIDWDSNVVLLSGPSPNLIVGPDGRIVKAINVSVAGVGSAIGSFVDPDANGNFFVDPIINDNDRGQALFRANDASTNGTIETALANGPLFTFRETYQKVDILNQSALDMNIQDIEVVNTFLVSAQDEVIIEVDRVNAFEFDVNHDFKPTPITISNTIETNGTSPDITFFGVVNNPIGMTNVFNARGDILSSLPGSGEFPPPPGLIRTDSFRINAVLGHVGRSDSQRLRLEIVESNDGPTGADRYRTSDAGQRNFMELRGLLRRALTGAEPTTGFNVDVERIKSGNLRSTDVNLELLNGLSQPTVVPGPYRVEVFEPAGIVNLFATPVGATSAPNRTTTVTDHFTTSPGSVPTVFPRGVWGAGTGMVEVRYVVGEALDADRRIISGANIDVVGLYPEPAGLPFINFLAWTDLGDTNPVGLGNIDIRTNGNITVTEELGDFRIGLIESTRRNVVLTGRHADIIDSPNEEEFSGTTADVVGINLTFSAPEGHVGTFENPLEINSSNVSIGAVKADAELDIVLVEIADLNVDRIRSESGDVSLLALDGSILDYFDDTAADVIGVNQFLTAQGQTIGQSDNDLDIDSSTVRPGRLVARANNSAYITETDSSLNVQSVFVPGGPIRLTVTDTAATDEDFILMEGGLIFSNETNITLNVGDDVDTRLGSAMFAAQEIFINGDAGNADIGLGSRIVLRGATLADRLTITTLRDDDEVRIENNATQTRILTSDGDDLIFGSDAGSDDPDLLDAVYFGDFIDAGPGNDRVFGLGGADVILAGDGADIIEGGAHGDLIRGGRGDDELRGGLGNDRIEGGDGHDDIDGGRGGDQILGEEGDDEIDAGGGTLNIIDGGAGDDVIRGSDEGADGILGGDGRDTIFGFAGNDVLVGGAGNDSIDGGAGDDFIQGSSGADVLVGGANNDQLFGDDNVAGDDNAVDYLWGDFGTGLNEAGSGRDRLDGQGGNDVLYGEGDDDQINDVLGASNLVVAGTGDDPSTIVLAPVTPNPVPLASTDDPAAVDTLPIGAIYSGWWAEIAGSATNNGLSGGVGAALDTAVTVDAAGTRYAAWADSRNGNYEIYVARQTSAGWQMLGGSAAGGGVSDSLTDSRRPALAVINGRVTVVWTEATANGTDIMGAQFDAGTDTWVTLGNSLLPGGISNTARADQAQIVIAGNRLVVSWIDTSVVSSVYARQFDGASWVEVTPGSATGMGITQWQPGVAEYDLATDGTNLAVTWSSGFGDTVDIYARVRSGATWVGLGSSAAGTGLSDTVTESREPDAAWLDGRLYVAYRERVNDFEQIHVKTFDGSKWVSAGIDGAVGNGVSNANRRSLDPKLESGGGQMFLAWVDHDDADYADPDARIYAKRWNGTRFVETLPGDASGGGISATGGKLSALDLAVGANGLPTVGWTDDSSGLPQAYLRTVTDLPGQVFLATSASGVQAILDAQTLGEGDVIVLAPGLYAGFTVSAADAGVTILGAQGGTSVINGAVQVRTTATLQRLNLAGAVTLTADADGAALVDNAIDAGVVINGAAKVQVLHNRFKGTEGIRIATASSGLIAHNDIAATGVGLAIDGAFDGTIEDNDIHGASLGVRYAAGARLSDNRIFGNVTGIRSTVSGETQGLGFIVGSTANDISSNVTGLQLVDASAQGQHIFGNQRGVAGSGVLGGASLDAGNLIEDNGTGVFRFDGTIRNNRIGGNDTAIDAASGSRIQGNQIYRSKMGVLIDGQSDVRIEGNTMVTPAGTLVRLVNGASDVEVLRNTLWTEDGYDLFVANDSQSGFFSDFNNLYATGTGKVGFWTRDFTDVLDWQADIARFDLHSVGATVVNPEWARPRFTDPHDDGYALFPMFGTQRFTSPMQTPATGVPHIALRSPDLYVDAIRNKPLAIRWESFNNTAGSPVRIDLYRDTADGPAFVTTIVASTADDGEFLWTPSANGVPFGTKGLRIQISWVANPVVMDRSQEPFTVPEDGTQYWVDDHSNANDEYTPAGIGDNRNTGKTAAAPKPYATNLLRVYDVGPGATIFVDTGAYSMIDPVAVSGTTDLGLGRDQGFLLTGPTSALRVAELFPAIPGDRTRPLIELNDADGVEVAHLTLRDAQRGLYAHGGSDDLSAHDLITFGHALDGIRLETNSAGNAFFDLTSHGNGGAGIAIEGAAGSLTSSLAYENRGGGIVLRGPIDEVLKNTARDNTGDGMSVRDSGESVIQGNASFRNTRGMRIDNASGGVATVGDKSLAAGTANLIWNNVTLGAQISGNVVFAGNSIADQTGLVSIGLVAGQGSTAMSNLIRGNTIGVDAKDALLQGNRVYGNAALGIRAESSDVLQNVVYSAGVGVQLNGAGSRARNNLVYDTDTAALVLSGAPGAEIVNNTLYVPAGDAMRIENASTGANLRNNIVWADNGYGIRVSADSQTGFASDNNVFFRGLFGTGNVGFWNGADRGSFFQWRAASGTDTDSIFASPLFVDADGADGVLGFSAGVSDGRDDDFHVRSQTGSFHGGSLAPVEGLSLPGIPGRPIAATAVLTPDAQQSPAIDRGDEGDAFALEPAPNGGFVNVGAYGNTAQASLSPAQFVIVMAPNGGESIRQLQTFDVRWRTGGFAGPVDISVSSTGAGGPYTAIATGETNDGHFDWTIDPDVFPAGTNYFVRVNESANPANADRTDVAFTVLHAPLVVTAFTPDVSGYSVRFNREFDPSVLNLYDGAGGGFGAADMLLRLGSTTVRGSVFLDADGKGFSFVKTGTGLTAGNYTLRIESGALALVDLEGVSLDGNLDGTTGDAYQTAFAVAAPTARISIADFVRGPEQGANVSGTTGGVPVRITGAGNFTQAEFELHYDPSMLTITGVQDPDGGTATVDLSVAGIAKVKVAFAVAVSGADREIVRLLGDVPATAPYTAKERLDLRNVSVDGGAAQADDGVHVVAYLGDTTGNARYSSLDAQRIQRNVVRLDSGFSAYPLADPVLIGDVSGNGQLASADALLIQRRVLGIPVPQLPPLPATPPAVFRSGPDPLVSLGTTRSTLAGGTVTVPVNLDTAAGLESAELKLRFDPDVLEVQAVRRGSLTSGFEWFLTPQSPGLLVLDAAAIQALSGGTGTLMEVDFRVKPGTAPGSYAVDLEWASLNEDGLTLNPAPQAGADPTDTSIVVTAPPKPRLPAAAWTLPANALIDALHGVPLPAIPGADRIVKLDPPGTGANLPAIGSPAGQSDTADDDRPSSKLRLATLLQSLARLTAKMR